MSNREERRLDETVIIDNDKTVIDGQSFNVIGSAHIIVPDTKDSFSILCSLDSCPAHQVLVLAREVAEYARLRMSQDAQNMISEIVKSDVDEDDIPDLVDRILAQDRRGNG